MERTTFSLLFYIRRTKLNKEGEAPIFMRITVNGQRADASTRRFLAPRLWNTAKGKAIEKGCGCKDLNLYLDAVSANVLRVQREMELEGAAVSAQSVLNRYLGKDRPERHTLLEVFREHNEKCRKLSGIDMAPATVERYETCLRLTEEFIRTTYKKDDLFLDELSRQFVEDYELYLKTVRKCCHNTTTKYLKNFKKITRISISKGWMKIDPFADIRFHLENVERDFLEKSELKKLLDKRIDIPRMAQVRDIFAFCCLTGLSFSDDSTTTCRTYRHGYKWYVVASQGTAENQKYVQYPPNGCSAGNSIPVQRQCLLSNAWRIVARVQQPKDEQLPERIGRHLRNQKTPLHPHRPAHVRHADPCKRRDH